MKTNELALATVLVALASCQMPGAEVIEAITGQCGLDNNSVKNIANEVMAAKAVAETDMQSAIFTNLTPERSGLYFND